MKKLQWIWDHIEEIILVPSYIATVLIIFLQVIMRFVFHNSLSWSEEAARYIFVWQVWLGTSYATHNRSHLRIMVLRDSLSPTGQRRLEAVVSVLWLIFCIYMAVQGFGLVKTLWKYSQVSAAMQIPMAAAYLSVPVGCTLMAARLIENGVKDFFYKNNEQKEVSNR